MPCYHPYSAWRTDSGLIEFSDRGRGDRIDLPCGQCIGCRLERSRQWATRIMLESKSHDQNSFLTLTYNDESVPYPPSLDYTDFQLFMKRMRKRLKKPLRFFMCGEYGDTTFRPHYHCCLFGHDFSDDRILWSRTPAGHDLFRSDVLDELWPFGHCLIGDLTFESAAYVARYCTKKITGPQAEFHYRFVSRETGEVHQLTPEFAHMSLKPGIGAKWFDKYKSDVYNNDYVIVRGVKTKPPRYFDKLLDKLDPDAFQNLKDDRSYRAYLNRLDNTDDRLAVKETVKLAAISQLSPRGDL